MHETENIVIEQIVGRGSPPEPTPVFILGAPRTGSTFLYQCLIAAYRLGYISNLTNDHFADAPILGWAIARGLPEPELAFESAFGKTRGALAPSEGSAIMQRWCGGGHPSELTSSGVLPDQRAHLRRTLAAAQLLQSTPILIKNAWNCFRVSALAELLPGACFIWIRRDIEACALSDLEARVLVQGSPDVWNSASPRNLDELRKLPVWEQVVENS